MQIEYTISIWQENSQFIAHAMPLDVMSCGQTQEEAILALEEAVQLFLITAADMGNLEDILSESGYQKTEHNWLSPKWIAIQRHLTTLAV